MKDEKKEKKPLPEFDADFSPANSVNWEAAAARELRFDSSHQCYVDDDGCPIRDRFGQPLG